LRGKGNARARCRAPGKPPPHPRAPKCPKPPLESAVPAVACSKLQRGAAHDLSPRPLPNAPLGKHPWRRPLADTPRLSSERRAMQSSYARSIYLHNGWMQFAVCSSQPPLMNITSLSTPPTEETTQGDNASQRHAANPADRAKTGLFHQVAAVVEATLSTFNCVPRVRLLGGEYVALRYVRAPPHCDEEEKENLPHTLCVPCSSTTTTTTTGF